ncbi:MAG: methionine--tRNA ligase [Gammaproteobacteria bacterium]|nr:MAG: methionine--tRNA ligase [Gammaproteobacteria bacterium]
MPSQTRDILVTSALPYANGPIHIGHLVEYIQTDIWVRFQRMAGARCLYLCASDAHGTPVMLKARELAITPEVLVERFRVEHQRDFAGFHIAFDNYHTTHSEENRLLVERIYARLREKNLVEWRTIRQAYDEQARMFLPDRFIRGTCPACGAKDQYGDSCESCGATYSPADLLDARSAVSGSTPVQKDSEHLFFRLGLFEDSLRRWTSAGHLDPSVARKLEEWFAAGLRDWDISRDAPYFGFRIPGVEDKYFYVWLDAPVGYMASLANLADKTRNNRQDIDFDKYWSESSQTELYHFIGKDIAYFHTLFWPAVLEGAGYRKPSGVFVHGFLTVNGQKMSKSRGTFIAAATYLEHLNPECLRYYYAFKLGPGTDDIDLNLEDFVARINSDLVGKFVNIASRCAGFINRQFDGELAGAPGDPALYAEFAAAAGPIAECYESREYARAMREIMRLADRANQFIDERRPWTLARDPARAPQVQSVCTDGLNLFRMLLVYLKPVLPALAARAEAFLGCGPLAWADVGTPLLGRRINAYEALITRIDPAAVARMVEASKATTTTAPEPVTGPSPAEDPMIDLDEFLRVDLRVARVLSAQTVEGADKLLRVTVDLGGEQRTVLAGIRAAYEPQSLIGRQVLLVANLKPRKMRFGVSEGMLLAAGDGGSGIFLVSPDEGAEPGMRVR